MFEKLWIINSKKLRWLSSFIERRTRSAVQPRYWWAQRDSLENIWWKTVRENRRDWIGNESCAY